MPSNDIAVAGDRPKGFAARVFDVAHFNAGLTVSLRRLRSVLALSTLICGSAAGYWAVFTYVL